MLRKTIVPTILGSCLVGVGACSFTQSRPSVTPNSTDTTQLPGTGITVRPANSTWIEEQFTTEVVNIGLENLGYTVEAVQQLDYAALHISLANSELDFTTGFYRVGHDDYFENAGGDAKLERIEVLVPGSGQQSIMVDKVTATEYQLSNITQLQDPELAKLFDTDGDDKANLAGCQVGWNCNEVLEHFIDEYGLTNTVEQDQGVYTALLADILARHRQGKPLMFFTYSPHWVLLELKPGQEIVPLEVPFTSLPGDLQAMTEADTTIDNKNLGFPVAEQMLLANQQFVDDNPVAKRWFELVKIPVEAMNAVSLQIQDGENTPEDVRRHAEDWVAENQTLFDNWLNQARSVAN
ncbi:MAG: glycine betaine/L-proline ABC transporter substrate-binding protein ProX [Cyanothece sp. SIO2G6]|nr:glycine betaine/L-proline ABC transporter substrate-binding protein ProX [Cyanothece sp. SIO2G6]